MADTSNTPPVPPIVLTIAEQQAAAEKAAQVKTVDEAADNGVKLPKLGSKVLVSPVYGPMHDITTNKPIPQGETRVTVNPWLLMQIAAKKLVVVD